MGEVSRDVRQHVADQIASLESRLPDAIALAVQMATRKPSTQVSISFGAVVTVNVSGTVDVLLDGEDTPVEMPTTVSVSVGDRVRVLFVPPAAAVVLNVL